MWSIHLTICGPCGASGRGRQAAASRLPLPPFSHRAAAWPPEPPLSPPTARAKVWPPASLLLLPALPLPGWLPLPKTCNPVVRPNPWLASAPPAPDREKKKTGSRRCVWWSLELEVSAETRSSSDPGRPKMQIRPNSENTCHLYSFSFLITELIPVFAFLPEIKVGRAPYRELRPCI